MIWRDKTPHHLQIYSRSGWHSKTRCQVFVIGEENHFCSKLSKTAPQNWRTVPCVRIVSRKMRSWNATPCSNKPLPHATGSTDAERFVHRFAGEKDFWTKKSKSTGGRPLKKANEKKPCVERWHCPQDFLDYFLVRYVFTVSHLTEKGNKKAPALRV